MGNGVDMEQHASLSLHLSVRERWLTTTLLGLGLITFAIDASNTQLILPQLMTSLRVEVYQIHWALTAPGIARTVVIAAMGWLIGWFGPRTLYLLCISSMTMGSLGSLLAWDWPSFVFFRVLAGVGGGMIPQISQAISLEIDGHSMNLHRLNAMLNGVADRMQVVDNAQPENLQTTLGGRELDFAVSNPPFNIVPKEYESSFTHFGYGGDHGIEITKIFLDQALPLLKQGGEFIYYSYLARDEKGDFFVTQFLQDNFKGLNLYYDNLDARRIRYFGLPKYAEVLANFLVEHGLMGEGPQDPLALARDIEAKLKERGVFKLEEKIGHVVKRGDSRPVAVLPSDLLQALRPSTLKEQAGGVYETIEPIRPLGGARLQKLDGVYLEQHLARDFEKDFRSHLKDPQFRKKICHDDPECERLFADPNPTKK